MGWNSSGDLAMEINRLFEQSDTWTEEDRLDVTTFSLQYAITLFPESQEIAPVQVSTMNSIMPQTARN